MTEKMGVALDLMRLEGICKMLTSTLDEETLENKYLSVTGQSKVENITKALAKLTKNDLRKIIEQSPEITEEVIVSFYNEYRYGRKPGFVLYLANGFIGKTIDKEQLKNRFAQMLGERHYKEDAKFKDLKCVAAEEWSANGTAVIELGMSYLKKYSYITAQNNFDYIHELTDCFAWISAGKGFVALYNMPPTIETIIKQIIMDLYGVKLLGISLDKETLNQIFDPSKRKKVSLTRRKDDSDKPQKVSFSDARFAEKQDRILADYSDYGIDSSLYDIDIDPETVATLGVNSNRGKLYINKNLKTSQFRQWSFENISEIINYFSEIFSAEGTEKLRHIQLFTGNGWERLSPSKKQILSELAKAILVCKEMALSKYPVDVHASDIKKLFPSQTDSCYFVFCDSCNEETIPECTFCQGKTFDIIDGKLVCCSCRKPVHSLKCNCGNTIPIITADSVLSVTLGDDLLAKIITELRSVKPGMTLAEHEFVAIHNDYLEIYNADGFKRISPKELPQCKELYEYVIPEEFVKKARVLFGRLGEKCKRPDLEKCAECRYKKLTALDDLECLQQLLCYFDDFVPSTHHGHEYGDLSISVTIDGRGYNLQGIMKSDNKKITRSGNTGREITDQVVKGLVDKRPDIICVIAPTQFDTQLSETLLTLAKRFNKKLMFWDFDFMVRLAYALEKRIDSK